MRKYKIYKNRKLISKSGAEHPAIDLGINKNGQWENLEITSSPTKNHSFTLLNANPNPSKRQTKENGEPIYPSYFRRYVRKDSKYDKLSEFKKYYLVEADEKAIDDFLLERERNILLDKQRREEARKRKNDAKLRYLSKGRSASIRNSGQASSEYIKTNAKKKCNKRMIKREKMAHDKTKK